ESCTQRSVSCCFAAVSLDSPTRRPAGDYLSNTLMVSTTMSSLLHDRGDSKQGHDQGPYRIDSTHLAMPFSKPVARLLSAAALGMESGETPVYSTGTCGDYHLSRDGCPLLGPVLGDALH
ncbi:hypothetical protein BDFG_05161, partial [Blastomyces dermatitidis ATCC 26199]